MSARVPHRDSPAPWKVYLTSNGALMGVGDKNAGGVTDYQGGFWGSGANKRANMHLVAAAPELYNSLVELLEPLERASAELVAHGKALDENGEAAFDRARAALAKARGDQ